MFVVLYLFQVIAKTKRTFIPFLNYFSYHPASLSLSVLSPPPAQEAGRGKLGGRVSYSPRIYIDTSLTSRDNSCWGKNNLLLICRQGWMGSSAFIFISKRPGLRIGPFSAGSGSSKSEFYKPDPDPTGTYQESIQTSKFFSHQTYFF